MRDFERAGRSEALGSNGMAATSHPLATMAAIDVLREGGNAIDAAVCAAAVLGVVESTQTGIGGDCFVLLMRDGKGDVIALNGSGWAPVAASIDWYLDNQIAAIASETPHAVTIPGAVATWARLVEDHGSMELARLLAPAIAAADEGYLVTERVARDWALQLSKLARNATAAAIFLPDGTAPSVGSRHRQPALAAALRAIAKDGPAVFYEGWIAEDMVQTLRGLGGLHTLEDFSLYRPEYVRPISANYRGYQLWECPPNGQGVVPLIMARLLDGFDPNSWSPVGVERYHVLAEIGRMAYADRNAFVGDPRDGGIYAADLLAEERISLMRTRISMSKRLGEMRPVPLPEHRDTVFVSVVDRDRNTVAFINSIFDDFGSGIATARSGVLFHNRGSGFVLTRGHPNAVAGRKRPMHTIIPAMLARNGRPVMPFGVTGGHFQPFGQIQLLSNIVDYGMGVQQALDLPRMFALWRHAAAGEHGT